MRLRKINRTPYVVYDKEESVEVLKKAAAERKSAYVLLRIKCGESVKGQSWSLKGTLIPGKDDNIYLVQSCDSKHLNSFTVDEVHQVLIQQRRRR